MRAAFAAVVVLAVLTAIVITGYFVPNAEAATGPISLNCNRACLENLVDQYLAAVVAHDPKRIPVSRDVMYTENDQVMELGDGFWKTAEAVGNYKHVWVDPEFGQVALMGTMREAGVPLLISLRLRVELGRITEIESVYYRQGNGGPNGIAEMDKPFKPEDMWFKSIPQNQRMSRPELIAVADGYLTGLEKNDGKGLNGTGTYPFTNDCHRIENGAPTTNVPRPANQAADVINAFSMDCMSQFKVGYYFVVQSIHHRRYPVVDQERGVPRRVRSGNGEQGCSFGRPSVQLQRIQPSFEHSGDRSFYGRGRKDSPGGDGRPVRYVSHDLAVAGQPQREVIFTSFRGLLCPARIETSPRFTPKCRASRSHTSSFARPLSGGATTFIFKVPSAISPATAERELPGTTLTLMVTVHGTRSIRTSSKPTKYDSVRSGPSLRR
jgi:hypothetical protein